MQVPAPFEYERPTSVDRALELLQRLWPEARLLAGGDSLRRGLLHATQRAQTTTEGGR